jgi:hypothetical protein
VEYELGRRIPPGDIIAAYERLFGSEARSLRQLLAGRGDRTGAGEQYRRALAIAAGSDNRAQEVTALVGLSGVAGT